MRVRRILQTGAFSPDDVNRMQEAFDMAWAMVGRTIETAEHPRCRELLATVVVSAGNVSGLAAEELAAVAVRTFESIRVSSQTLL
jgi:hypothetical protein